MCYAYNEKNGKENTKRKRTTQPGKNQNYWRKRKYKYQGILEANIMNKTEIKEKVRKEYHQRTRKLLEIKLKEMNN